MKLTLPALLGSLVSEQRSSGKCLEGGFIIKGVRGKRAADAGGEFGATRHLLFARTIGEGIHLLGHHVRGFTHGPGKNLGEFEHGRRHLPKTITRRDITRSICNLFVAAEGIGQQIMGAADRLETGHA